MKKINNVILGLCFISLSTIAKDYDYYQANIDEAVSKNDKCTSVIEALAEAGNTEKMLEFLDNTECNAAKKAIKKSKSDERAENMRLDIEAKNEKKKQNNAKKTKMLQLYDAYAEIPIEQRVLGGALVTDWVSTCKDLNYKSDNPFEDTCNLAIPGKKVYHNFSKELTKANIQYESLKKKCVSFYNDKVTRKKAARRPSTFRSKESVIGANECHAIFDFEEAKLTKNYLKLNLEHRLEKAVACDISDDSICLDAMKSANKSIKVSFKKLHTTSSGQYKNQKSECQSVSDKYKDNSDYKLYKKYLRKVGECAAVRYY